MTTLAIFVEGQTELLFVERLLFELVDYQHLAIERQIAHGNSYYQFGVRGAPQEDARHIILLVNCQCDGKVLSAIEERAHSLHNAGYEIVLGLRDIYPLPSEDLDEIYGLASERLKQLPLPCKLVIAVREIEAWFLSDISHFQKYDEALTVDLIEQRLGVNVATQNVELVRHPSALLHKIYEIAGGEYRKKLSHAHRVAEILNYEFLYLDAPNSVSSLKLFVDELDAAII